MYTNKNRHWLKKESTIKKTIKIKANANTKLKKKTIDGRLLQIKTGMNTYAQELSIHININYFKENLIAHHNKTYC